MRKYLSLVLAVAVGLTAVLELSSTAVRAQTPSRNPDDYHAAFAGQNSYPTLEIGGCYQFEIKFRNTGRATWYRGVVNLGTDRPRDRIPGFIREDRCNRQPSGWISPNRVELREASVPPGGVGTFVFFYTVPHDHATGMFREYFRPVADGVTWMEDCGCYWDVTVTATGGRLPIIGPAPQPTPQPAPRGDACDTPRNGSNCVYYARCRVPSLPGNLFTYQQKAARRNSSTPRVGAVAIMNIYAPWGHVAVVEQVLPDSRILVREGNYHPGRVTERTGYPADMRVTGYYQP